MSPLPPPSEQFLRELSRCLSPLPEEERRDVVAEIRSHLAERAAAGADPLAGFARPEAYAATFLQERALAGALSGGSSFALGRALLSGAGRLTWWYVVAVLAVAHAYGVVLIALAAAKPLFPDHVGLFRGSHLVLGAAFGPHLEGTRELLGWWAVPAFLIPGVLLLWGGNFALRWLGRWRVAALARARAA